MAEELPGSAPAAEDSIAAADTTKENVSENNSLSHPEISMPPLKTTNGSDPTSTEVKPTAPAESAAPESSIDEKLISEPQTTTSQESDPIEKTDAPVDEQKTTPPASVAEANSNTEPTHELTPFAVKEQARREHLRETRHNIKSDPSSLEESSDPVEIRKQVEFYLSDSNLWNDEFMFKKTGGPKNYPVPLKLIHSFKRMQRFQPFEAIVEALKDSKCLDVGMFLKQAPSEYGVKRKEALAEIDGARNRHSRYKSWQDKTISRSIYAKGFGDEKTDSQFAIEAFFTPHGPLNAVRLRRTKDQFFKGSVFVEFADEQTMQTFWALDPKPQWNGEELMWKTKQDYIEGKEAIYGKFEPKTSYQGDKGSKGGRGDRRGGRGGGHGRGHGRGGRFGGGGNVNRGVPTIKSSRKEVKTEDASTTNEDTGNEAKTDEVKESQPNPLKRVHEEDVGEAKQPEKVAKTEE